MTNGAVAEGAFEADGGRLTVSGACEEEQSSPEFILVGSVVVGRAGRDDKQQPKESLAHSAEREVFNLLSFLSSKITPGRESYWESEILQKTDGRKMFKVIQRC